MADLLELLRQALMKKKQIPVEGQDTGIDPNRPWDSPVLREAVPPAAPVLAVPPPTPVAQGPTIEEALALAEKLRKQKAMASALLPEQIWNK
jgi:hypothetical protein